MAVAAAVLTRQPRRPSTPRNRYSAFGLHIASEVPLPIPSSAPVGSPDLTIRRAHRGSQPPEAGGSPFAETTCDEACHRGEIIGRSWRTDAGTLIWSRDTGIYHVAPDARQVTVYPQADADERAIALVLLGQVSIFVLHQRGYASLHASAVLLNGAAVAFVGPPGAGKSTMAGCFLRHGATLLTDDVLPLDSRVDAIYGLPGAPVMKVWTATARQTLGIRADLPDLTSRVSKKLLSLNGRYEFARGGAPLRAVYVLVRYDPTLAGESGVSIQKLAPLEAFPLLMHHSPRCEMLFPREAARLLPLYARLMAQAPVRVLRLPNGFEHHEAVRQHVLNDLEVTA